MHQGKKNNWLHDLVIQLVCYLVLACFQKPHQTARQAQSVIQLVWFRFWFEKPHQTTKPAQSVIQLVWCWFWFGFINLTRPRNQPKRLYNWFSLLWFQKPHQTTKPAQSIIHWFGVGFDLVSEISRDHETSPIGYTIGLAWFGCGSGLVQKPHQTTKPTRSVIIISVRYWFGFRSLTRPRNQPNLLLNWFDSVWFWF